MRQGTFKIVGTDNLNRETIADRLVVGNVPDTKRNRQLARDFCRWLNTFTCNPSGGYFYGIKEADYKLSRGMADIVGD
jgi:hypothetical protein